jgi:hypothetical protein
LVQKLGLSGSHIKEAYKIVTLGGSISSSTLIHGVHLGLGNKAFPGMDVILGMDWMTRHKVVPDISGGVVAINSPSIGHTTLYLPFKDGANLCAYVTITSHLKKILVVCEYLDVFPNELSSMTQDRDV